MSADDIRAALLQDATAFETTGKPLSLVTVALAAITIGDLRREIDWMLWTLRQVEELATDTPDGTDMQEQTARIYAFVSAAIVKATTP